MGGDKQRKSMEGRKKPLGCECVCGLHRRRFSVPFKLFPENRIKSMGNLDSLCLSSYPTTIIINTQKTKHARGAQPCHDPDVSEV